jgi:hypothetical protein
MAGTALCHSLFQSTWDGSEKNKLAAQVYRLPTIFLSRLNILQKIISTNPPCNNWTSYNMRFTRILGFFHRPETATSRKMDLFPSSNEGMETPSLLGPLERANLNHWTQGNELSRCSRSLPEERNRLTFRNVMFSSYLEFRTTDNAQ